MANKRETLVELQQVVQAYETRGKPFVALEKVDLVVHSGEFVALLGPSGCGKSTLLRLVTGLQRPTSGAVLYRGRPVEGVNPHASMVFQSFALFPWFTVLQNVELALYAQVESGTERRRLALEALERVGLDGFEAAYPRELSGGMRQKVGFARAIAASPELLCLDEPFSALDVLSAQSLRGELVELWTSGRLPIRAILMVTHNIDEAVELADRIVVMEKHPGRVVAELAVPFPHPRRKRDPHVQTVVDHVYTLLAGQTAPEAEELGVAPGEVGKVRALPPVTVSALSGLVEHLAELADGKADIFRLGQLLHLDADHLLNLTDAGELLGFVHVASGDVQLTPIGARFAHADIAERKEVFRSQVQRLPLFRWVQGLLHAADEHALERDVVEAALEIEFSAQDARSQMDTLIQWGRYAELFDYDAARGLLLGSAPKAFPGNGAPPPQPA